MGLLRSNRNPYLVAAMFYANHNFINLTDADYGRVEMDVVETAKLGDSSNDVLGVVEVKLPCYVRENANPSAHPPSEASSGMAAIGLDVGLDPGLGPGPGLGPRKGSLFLFGA
ncbi:hypothetical protein ACFX11_012714 [Malus domestica]